MRPTQDLVREAIFSILHDKITDCVFLDLCAGTGAVGLDALSRGASSVVLVEKNRANAKFLKVNAGMLKGVEPKIFYGDAVSLLKSFRNRYQFDVIFSDPPYEKHGESQIIKKILKTIDDCCLLDDGGIVIFFLSIREKEVVHDAFEIFKEKNYGKTKLVFYRKVTG